MEVPIPSIALFPVGKGIQYVLFDEDYYHKARAIIEWVHHYSIIDFHLSDTIHLSVKASG